MKNKHREKSGTDRRKFLKLGLVTSVTALAGSSLVTSLANETDETDVNPNVKKTRLLTPDGKIVEIDYNGLG